MSDKIPAFYTGFERESVFRPTGIQVDVVTIKSSSNSDTVIAKVNNESSPKSGSLRIWTVINGGLFECDFSGNVV